MLLSRRRALAGCGGAILILAAPRVLTSPGALAQAASPNRTIKIIVPYLAGGTTDFLGHVIADQLKTGLGATVVVENMPGAATHGAAQVAKSVPDGYTLLMATSTTLAVNKALHKKLPYDPVKDFAPVALLAAVPFALI